MAFHAKTDYCGLSAITELANNLVVKDDSSNLSVEKYQPQGQDGSFVATEVYGEDSAPTNNYGFKGSVSLASGKIKLNKITTITAGSVAKSYALESVTIKTSAGSAPTISATCQQVESGVSDSDNCHYSIPALSLTSKQHAQDIFSAVTLTGTGCTMTEASFAISSKVNKDKVAGVTIASDVNSGVITMNGTVLQTGATEPTIAASTGWIVTSPLSPTNAETAYKTWSFEAQYVLAKDAATSAS